MLASYFFWYGSLSGQPKVAGDGALQRLGHVLLGVQSRMPITAELAPASRRLELDDLGLGITERSARFHGCTDRVPRGGISRTAKHRPNSCKYLRLGIVAA